MITWNKNTATCSHCHTDRTFTAAQVRRGDDVVLAVPCHAPDCHAQLCANCEQFICDGCGLAHCVEHRIRYAEMALCPTCMREVAEADASDMEIATQDESGFVCAMAEAGLTLPEVEAFARVTRHE